MLADSTFFTEIPQMIINSPWKRASQSSRRRPDAGDPGRGRRAEQAAALSRLKAAGRRSRGSGRRHCKESWPDHPEWVDMLTAILQDEPMSSTYGWFRTAVAQTRFDWAATPQALRSRRRRHGSRAPSFPAATPISLASTATTTRH